MTFLIMIINVSNLLSAMTWFFIFHLGVSNRLSSLQYNGNKLNVCIIFSNLRLWHNFNTLRIRSTLGRRWIRFSDQTAFELRTLKEKLVMFLLLYWVRKRLLNFCSKIVFLPTYISNILYYCHSK